MLSPGIVREVSRTAVPALVSGWALHVDELIERTTGRDWEECYYILTKSAARRVAGQINKEQPWRTPKVVPAITAGQAIKGIAAASALVSAEVLEGELVS